MKLGALLLLLFANVALAEGNIIQTLESDPTPRCIYADKDYKSPGFSTMKRDGFYIKGRFGCVYLCSCGGKTWRVTSVLQEKHFDIDFFSKDPTGGPDRAKWFICPNAIKEWNEVKDPTADWITLYWDAVPQDQPLSIDEYAAPEIHAWAAQYCSAEKK